MYKMNKKIISAILLLMLLITSISVMSVSSTQCDEQEEFVDLELTKEVFTCDLECYNNLWCNPCNPDEYDFENSSLLKFELTLENNGPDNASWIIVKDFMPDNFTIVDYSDNKGIFNIFTNTWTIFELKNGETAKLKLFVITEKFGTFTNIAEVIEAEQEDTDSTPGNNDPSEDDYDSVTFTIEKDSNSDDDNSDDDNQNNNKHSKSNNNQKKSEPKEEPNQKPTADVSNGENIDAFVGENILFDGSPSYDIDGQIVEWFWDFDDKTSGEGELIDHNFTKPGMYLVKLKVTDDDDATDFYNLTVDITWPNRAPFKPEIITDKTNGEIDIEYIFSFISTDPDGDMIKYLIEWGDGTQSISDFIKSGEKLNLTHIWKNSGEYNITVKAFDNELYSENETISFKINEKSELKTDILPFGVLALIVVAITAFLVAIIEFKRRKFMKK